MIYVFPFSKDFLNFAISTSLRSPWTFFLRATRGIPFLFLPQTYSPSSTRFLPTCPNHSILRTLITRIMFGFWTSSFSWRILHVLPHLPLHMFPQHLHELISVLIFVLLDACENSCSCLWKFFLVQMYFCSLLWFSTVFPSCYVIFFWTWLPSRWTLRFPRHSSLWFRALARFCFLCLITAWTFLVTLSVLLLPTLLLLSPVPLLFLIVIVIVICSHLQCRTKLVAGLSRHLFTIKFFRSTWVCFDHVFLI